MSQKQNKLYKVKKFKSAWLNEIIDDVKVGSWLIADPSDPQKGKCTVCPPPSDSPFTGRSFSIGEGVSAIRKHWKNKIHQKSIEKVNNNMHHDDIEQMRIQQALKNQEEITRKERKEQDAILQGQIAFANMLHFHGVPSHIFTCFAKMVPTIFPDSQIAKKWASGGKHGFRSTKADYFLTHGIYPFQLQNLVSTLKTSFFSLNFDETSINLKSQLDINVSFLKDEVIVKENLTTISMEGGTTAAEIVDAVFSQLESFLIPLENIMIVTTDGCSTMLGNENGVHSLMRRRLPHLPTWGGCTCHDLSNLLKAAFPKLNPNLGKLYATFHSYLSSQSLHRKREYEEACREEGFEPHAIPAMCDTRFRMNIRFAKWMERDDRCLYLFAISLRDKVKSGDKKDVTDAETVILKEFLENYLMVRLTNMFFIDVSDPILIVLNHFESEDPIIHKRWHTLADFFTKFLSKFMKNAGGEKSPINELLDMDFTVSKNQLSDQDIFLGGKVESFLKELNLTRSSSEIKPWLENVRSFYIEALQKCVKYMRPSLTSRTLLNLQALNPKFLFALSVDEAKKKFAFLAKKFPNVINQQQVPDLLEQVSLLKFQQVFREAASELRPTEFYVQVSKDKDERFRLVSKMCLALLTTHNSGSTAERDISTMSSLLADPRKNRTQQLRLQARLKIRSSSHNLKHKCKECNANKLKKHLQLVDDDDDTDEEVSEEELSEEEVPEVENDGEVNEGNRKIKRCTHCHCDLFKVEDDLKTFMSDGQPYRRWMKEVKEKRVKRRDNERAMQVLREENENKYKADLKTEMIRLRKKLREDMRQKMTIVPSKPLTSDELKEQRSQRKRDLEQQRTEKRKKLFLALDS